MPSANNPQQPPQNNKKGDWRSLIQNIILIVFIFLVISSLFSVASLSGKSPQVSLSQLVQQIDTGKVKTISVSGANVAVTYTDGTKATAVAETNASLSDTLNNLGVAKDKLQQVQFSYQEQSGVWYWVGLILPYMLTFLLFGLFLWWMTRQAQSGQMQAMSFGRANIRMYTPGKDAITFHDVAGCKEAKEDLQEVVEFLKFPQKFLDMGARIPRGVLLMGAPGTGKTLLARAVAGEANVPFFHISGSEFVEMFVGVGASRVRDLFRAAKKMAPAIIFIDEIDAVGRQRGAGLGGGHDEREQTLNQILVEMDGFDRDTNVIVMAATNRPDVLDAALLRPGRFDRRVVLDEPDINDREAILAIHAKGKKFAEGVNLREIAERTPGFSGADLANLLNEAAIEAARQSKKGVEQIDLVEAIEKVLLGPERKSHVLSTREKKVTAYHEAGHALAAAALPDTDEVHKVSIISRGRAGGYTLKLPSEDKHLRTKSELLSEIAVGLGGYAAEREIFHDVTTGSSNDLQNATSIARELVMRFGMSNALGPISLAEKQEMVFLGRELTSGKEYSEETARRIDEEVMHTINMALAKTANIIRTRKDYLVKIAEKLIQQEVVERKEFAELMHGLTKESAWEV